MAERKLVEQAAEELYGLPPGEFTRARDARVKAVRKDGDREAADAIKALRKPTVAAWALNQLARARSKDVDRLLAAGAELRAAQEDLLGGGDRAAFQEAASKERELVAALSADAATLASEVGERAGGLREKAAATLHAAALDEEVGEELRAGRLVREREAIGGFGAAAAAAEAAPSRTQPRRESRAQRARSRAKTKTKPAEDASRPRSKAKTEPAREDAASRQRLAVARTDERHAQRELDAATKALAHAQERAEAAEAHAAEAAKRAKTTAERLKEARRAETAARKAHTRAARALESAERGSAGKS